MQPALRVHALSLVVCAALCVPNTVCISSRGYLINVALTSRATLCALPSRSLGVAAAVGSPISLKSSLTLRHDHATIVVPSVIKQLAAERRFIVRGADGRPTEATAAGLSWAYPGFLAWRACKHRRYFSQSFAIVRIHEIYLIYEREREKERVLFIGVLEQVP